MLTARLGSLLLCDLGPGERLACEPGNCTCDLNAVGPLPMAPKVR